MKRTKNEAIYHKIKKKILDRELYPGQKLSEQQLGEKFGVSRTPMREIFKRLEREGLVMIKPKSGTYVLRKKNKEYIELFQIRTYLECLAYRLACKNVKRHSLNVLEDILNKMDQAVEGKDSLDFDEFSQLHYEFHLSLVKLSKNETLLTLFEELNLPSTKMMIDSPSLEAYEKTKEEHLKIFDCLKRSDPKGEELLKHHLWTKAMFLTSE